MLLNETFFTTKGLARRNRNRIGVSRAKDAKENQFEGRKINSYLCELGALAGDNPTLPSSRTRRPVEHLRKLRKLLSIVVRRVPITMILNFVFFVPPLKIPVWG